MRTITFAIEVPIGPEWRNVELLRTAVLNCLLVVFQNSEFCEAVGVVTGELLENAVKYGDWSRPDQSGFQLKVRGNDESVRIEVSNPITGRDDAARLLQTLAWLDDFDTPQQAFEARLRELADRSPDDTSSRLGLVRVAYEGNCSLQAHVEGHELVRVVATTPRP